MAFPACVKESPTGSADDAAVGDRQLVSDTQSARAEIFKMFFIDDLFYLGLCESASEKFLGVIDLRISDQI